MLSENPWIHSYLIESSRLKVRKQRISSGIRLENRDYKVWYLSSNFRNLRWSKTSSMKCLTVKSVGQAGGQSRGTGLLDGDSIRDRGISSSYGYADVDFPGIAFNSLPFYPQNVSEHFSVPTAAVSTLCHCSPPRFVRAHFV